MTPIQIADTELLTSVKELSYAGMVVIGREDLKQILRDVAERAHAEGLEAGRKLGPRKKTLLSKQQGPDPIRRIRPVERVRDESDL